MITDECDKASVEKAFLDTDYHEDTWDALADMYENVTGKYPCAHFDLLGWFLVHCHYHRGEWVYIKNILNS